MKAKIIAGLILFCICFTLGGFIMSRAIDEVIEKLEYTITIHQMVLQSKTLENDVKLLQQELLLRGSPHAKSSEEFLFLAERAREAINQCLSCHHVQETRAQLDALAAEIGDYQNNIKIVSDYEQMAEVEPEKISKQRELTFSLGQQILQDSAQIDVFSATNLAEKTKLAKIVINQKKDLLTIILFIGPLMALFCALYFINYLAGSVSTLVKASRGLRTGDLNIHVSGLYDEFGELGDIFNEMALSLKQKIAEIKNSEKRYKILFESAGDAIFVLKAEGADQGQIISANSAAIKMYGYSAEELTELNIANLDTPKYALQSKSRIEQMQHSNWVSAEIEHQKRDGTLFPVEISTGAFTQDGQHYILAFIKDITERKQTEIALQRAEQLAVVGEFAAGLAHEIKNPLAGIKVSIEVISSEIELSDEDTRVFEQITNEIVRIESLLKNLLNYAKPPVPNLTLVDINSVVLRVVKTATFTMEANKSGVILGQENEIKFCKELAEGLPLVQADSDQLQQVILNLLINAIHATKAGGIITITTRLDDAGQIEIIVTDDGKGFEGELEKIFQPFFTTKPKGTGLGLAICKRLINQHRGTIEVERNPTKGLTFLINLPGNIPSNDTLEVDSA